MCAACSFPLFFLFTIFTGCDPGRSANWPKKVYRIRTGQLMHHRTAFRRRRVYPLDAIRILEPERAVPTPP